MMQNEFRGNGKFLYVKDLKERARMQKAFKAIEEIDAWDFMQDHFTFKVSYDNNIVKTIWKKMNHTFVYNNECFGVKYDVFTDFCRVMRDMHHLAFHGEDVFKVCMQSRQKHEALILKRKIQEAQLRQELCHQPRRDLIPIVPPESN